MRRKNISLDVLNRALTKPAFLRIIRELNIKNVNHFVYEELRSEIKVELEDLLYKLDILLKYKKKKTISINDVMFFIDDPENFLKGYRIQNGETVKSFVFQKKPFKEFIQLIMQYMNCEYNMKKGVPTLIQYYIETFLKDILRKSKVNMETRKKKKLLPEDLKKI